MSQKFKRDVTFHVPLDRLPPSTPSIDSLSMYQPTSGERVLRITALFRSESQSNRLSCRSQVTVRASNHPRWHAICPNTLRDFQILDPLPIRSCCFLMHTSATYDATLFEVVYEAQLEPENASIGSIAENSTSNSLPHVRWISLHEEFIEPSHWPLPLTFWFQFNPNQYLNSDQRRRLIAIRLTLSTRQRLPPFQHHQVISMHFKRNRRSVVIAQNQSASMKINLNGAVPFQSHFPVRPSKHFNSADYHWSSLAKTPIYARLVRTNSANLYRVGESIALKLICTGWPVSARFYYVVQSNGRLLWSGVLRMTGTVHVFRLIALPSMSPMSVVSVYGEHVALTDFVQIQVESEVDRRTVETSHINLNHRTDDNVLTYGLRRLANLHYLQAQLPFSSVLLTALCRQPNLAPFFLHHTQREIQTLNQLFDFPQVKWNVAKHAVRNIQNYYTL